MLNLPKISKIAAQYANMLARSHGEISLSLHDTNYYLEFYEASLTSYHAETLVILKIDSQPCHLLLESFFFEDYLKSFFPDLNIKDVNPEARMILIDMAFEEIITTVKNTLGVEKIEISGIDTSPNAESIAALLSQNLMQFPFRICNDENEKRNGLLMMDAHNASEFMNKIGTAEHHEIKNTLDLSRLYTPVTLSLGFAKFMILELNRLRVGDVILIHSFKAAAQGFYAHLWAQKQALFLVNIKDADIIVEKKMDLSMVDDDEDFFDFEDDEIAEDDDDQSFKDLQEMISPQELEAEGTVANEMPNVPEPEPAAPQASQTKPAETDLKHLNMTLNFVVGSQVMSLEELQNLSPGYHFNLNKTPTSPISILANGKDFATGELVQIEDKIGVKLTHINIKK